MSQLLRIILVIGLTFFLPASASAIDLGDAADFALLAMPDGSDEPEARLFSSARVVGDIGIGEDGTYRVNAGAQVDGDALLETGVATFISGSADPGTIFLNSDLSQAILDAIQASADADALLATQTFGTINTSTTWTRTTALNVIDVDTIDLGAFDVLTLSGNLSDFFIVNVATDFDMSGSSLIAAAGGLNPSHILFNFPTVGSFLSMTAVSTGIGTFLAPLRDARFDGNLVTGAVIANDIRIGSSGRLVHHPFGSEEPPPEPPPPLPPPIPEPASSLLLGLGLLGAGRYARRVSSQSSTKLKINTSL